MGVQERKAREKEGLRQEILDAARQLFVEDGYGSVSMRKIAEKIEYSPTTIYLHFKDKNDLFDCICEDTFGKLIESMAQVDRSDPDPVVRLRTGLRAYIDFGLAHPQHYVLTFMTDAGPAAPDCASRRLETGCRAFGCLQESVSECIAAGCLSSEDASKVSQILWAGVHGVTSLLITHPDFPWIDQNQLIDGLIDALIDGLKRKTS